MSYQGKPQSAQQSGKYNVSNKDFGPLSLPGARNPSDLESFFPLEVQAKKDPSSWLK